MTSKNTPKTLYSSYDNEGRVDLNLLFKNLRLPTAQHPGNWVKTLPLEMTVVKVPVEACGLTPTRQGERIYALRTVRRTTTKPAQYFAIPAMAYLYAAWADPAQLGVLLDTLTQAYKGGTLPEIVDVYTMK